MVLVDSPSLENSQNCKDIPLLSGEESCGSVRFDIPLVTRTEFHSSQPKQYTWSPLDSDSGDSVTQQFLKPPPRQRERKPRRKKRKHNHTEKCKSSSRKASVKTIDSIPASIPEENSEDVASSDPDIETVEYVKNSDHYERRNQDTVQSIHQIFAELDELVCEQGEDVWEEKARWMKFEQDIHRGADKWGKPHVAFLQLQSIISLRKCIDQGTVLLGMKAFDLQSVIEISLDRLVSRALITSSVAGKLKTLLLKRHVHIGEHQQEGMLKFRVRGKGKQGLGVSPEITPPNTRVNSRTNSEQDLIKMKQHFLRKLPADTEASNVMIGKLDYLEAPICVTIRLSHSILLGDITEVPIPTRFIFLLLCPQHSNIDHVEVGRAASTLFSDEMFYKAAYIASSKAQVIQGIDRFLEKAIVIPPSEWDPKMKITMPEEQDSSDEMLEQADVESGNVEAHHNHVMPGAGVLCDLGSLQQRWFEDWRRGIQLSPLLAPLQFSVILISYTLLLHQLASQSLQFSLALSLTAVFGMGILTSFTSCQPMVLCCMSLPTVLWEVAVAEICSQVGVEYHLVRPLVGVVLGILLMLASLLNAGNFFPYVSVFVYETVISSLPFALVAVVALAIGRLPQESHLVACSAVLFLLTLVFLKIWQAFSDSTLCTKKIRMILKVLQLPSLIVLTTILVMWTPLTTMAYLEQPTNSSSMLPTYTEINTADIALAASEITITNGIVITPTSHAESLNFNTALYQGFMAQVPVFPGEVRLVVVGAVAGIVLTVLQLVLSGLVYSWVVQPNHRLKRFSGRFWDQILVGIAAIFSGLFNLPFMVPDPLLTPILLHLISVPSTSNPDMLYIRVQRVTLSLTCILVVISILIVPFLSICLPLPLCWGVVIFHSILGLKCTQFYERCKILLQSEKYHPEKNYVANTPQRVINSYTIVQVVIMCVLVVVMVTPYTCSALPFFLVLLILLRRHVFPLVVFEELISLLEDSNSPVQPEQPYVSPSQSLTNQAEFSEEVTKISNSVTDNTNCVTDHASCVTDHASCVTDHASCMAEEGDGTKGHSDYVFPQIIFDNLTDDDNIECSNNKSRDSVPDETQLVIRIDREPQKFDFLGRSSSFNSCPLPFQQEEEPLRSRDPYTMTNHHPGFLLPD